VADIGGVQLPPVTVPLPRPVPAALLRAGTTLQGVVRGQPGDLVLQVAGQRIPIPSSSSFQPGQTAFVRIVETQTGVQLLVTPQPAPPSEGTVQDSALAGVLARILETLHSTLPAQSAAQLVPAALPANEPALRSLMALFTSRGSTADDLRSLAALISRAAAEGALPPATAQEFAAWVAQLGTFEPMRLASAVEWVLRNAGYHLEAQLAQAAESDELDDLAPKFQRSVRAQLAALIRNPTLLKYLETHGNLRRFHEAAERVLDRFSAAQFQNLRALELPYFFAEIPFPQGGPIRHGQLHVFGGESRRGFDPRNATVVLDLSTSRLGSLWISLQAAAGTCTCWFRATESAAVEVIEAHSDDLVKALGDAGYPRSQVRVMLWDGDRLAAAAALMRRFSSFGASA